MLGWILLGMATVTVGVTVIRVISGKITRKKAQEVAQQEEIKNFLVEKVDRLENRVKVKDLDSDNRSVEICGDGIADNIHEGEKITVSA